MRSRSGGGRRAVNFVVALSSCGGQEKWRAQRRETVQAIGIALCTSACTLRSTADGESVPWPGEADQSNHIMRLQRSETRACNPELGELAC